MALTRTPLSRHTLRGAAAATLGMLLLGGVLTGCGGEPAPGVGGSTESATTQGAVGTEHPNARLPEGFSEIRALDPSITVDLRYATTNNFTGRVVDGYESTTRGVMRTEAAEALAAVQRDINDQGLGLLIWDAYRPARAVNFFVAWSLNDDQSTKTEYYPDFEKPQLFELGYIAKESRHTLGGTVDLTLVQLGTGELLDMGGAFDFFGERSNVGASGLSAEQEANRATLREAMLRHGFEPYAQEWWHFSFPLPSAVTPSDFVIR